MFGEARGAEVYIADLTGANPNVYLELGVRWALRDRVTVPICQSPEDLRFNVAASRAIIYGPDNIVDAAARVVDAIRSGLSSTKSNSIVRADSEYVTISREELEELRSRIAELERERGEVLVGLAMNEDNQSERIELLRAALRVNPGSTEALLELGKALREAAQYAEAIEHLAKA
jgi:tetratricopeptide (TPR) repeat protein